MKRTPLYTFARFFLPWLFRIIVPLKVNGADNMPKNGGVIVCCNHASMTDPLRLAYSQRRQIYFMSKIELFKNKFVGFIIRALGAFTVSRGTGDKDAIDTARKILDGNGVLGIFIEGTRSKDGKLQRPKSGAVRLASKCNASILPCCITAKKGALPRAFHTSIVSYGKPISPEELNIQNGTPSEYRAASRLVMGRIAELRERDLKKLNGDAA